MFKFLLSLITCFLPLLTFAQEPSIRIDKVNAGNYCIGTELTIDVTITGVYSANNKFTVLAFRAGPDSLMKWSYPAELRENKLVTVLKATELGSSERFYLKVISSNPQKETEIIESFQAITKSTVRLGTKSGYSADTINVTDPIELALTTQPMSTADVTLNTGEKFNLVSAWDYRPKLTTLITLAKTKQGSYFVTKAENACGAMGMEGKVDITTNPFDIMPVSISPASICEGSEFKVIFNTQNGEFATETKYKIRFHLDFNNNITRQRYVDVPAVLTGKNELTAKFVSGFTLTELQEDIYVGIVTENPYSVSGNKLLKIDLYKKPSFSLSANAVVVNVRDEVVIFSNIKAPGTTKLTLTSGQVFNREFVEKLEKTTQYKVQKFESGCGTSENPPQTPLTVHVRPSLYIGPAESLEVNVVPKVYCEGKTARIRFWAAGVIPQTTYVMEGFTRSKERFAFPAKVVGDSLEFFIPKNAAHDPTRDYGDLYQLRLVSSNPALTSPYAAVRIQSEPYMIMTDYSAKSVPYPSAIRNDFNVYGGGPYKAETFDGSIENFDQTNVWFYQFIRKDTTFRLKSLSNQCFKNSSLPTYPLKVINPADDSPAVFARLIKKDYCFGDSTEVEVNFDGTFEKDNVFQLSYFVDAGGETAVIRNITKSGIHKVLLPDRNGQHYTASFMISSSLPRLTSLTERFDRKSKPGKARLSPEGTKQEPVESYVEETTFAFASTYPYADVRYVNDGKEGQMIADNYGYIRNFMQLENHKISEFKVTSTTNSCGTNSEEVSTFFYGIGYDIILEGNGYSRCKGMPTEVVFHLERGKADPNTEFTLQISATSAPDSYTDLAKISSGYVFRFKVPDLPSGGYFIRIKSSDDILSEAGSFFIGEAPTAIFRTAYGPVVDTTVFVEYGSPLYLNAYLSNNGPWGLVYSDSTRQTSSNVQVYYAPIITTPQTFSIKKVWNSCGFGTAKGTVTVKVKPVLEITNYVENPPTPICPGQTLELDFQIKGVESLGQDNLVFSLVNEQQEVIKLDSTKTLQGKITLKIPESITGRYFYIYADISESQVQKRLLYLLYVAPHLTLFGDNTITAGESTTLFVRADNDFASNTFFELSDGSKHVHTNPREGMAMHLEVKPAETTTYSIKEITKKCGVGKFAGTATITVQPKLGEWLSMNNVGPVKTRSICNTDTVSISFDYHGESPAPESYIVLLSDSTGKDFNAIPVIGNTSPILAVVPTSVKQSDFYRLRLVTTDQKVSGSTYRDGLPIHEYASATVITPEVSYHSGESPSVILGFDGSAPFFYQYGDANFYQSRRALGKLDTLRFTPIVPESAYKILKVENVCGVGKILEPSSFRIELITGTEPLSKSESILFGPNPTNGELHVRFKNDLGRDVSLINVKGETVYTESSRKSDVNIDMKKLAAGIYILQVKQMDKVIKYKVLKY